MSESKAVATKIIEAWKRIGSIPKNGRNPKFNYAFVREEDAADAIRKAFIEVGLSIVPSVKSVVRSVIRTKDGAEMQHVLITMTFKITDPNTGESESFDMVGEAADSFDKATYKAITGCTKYAYTKLALSGAEDNEEDDDKAPVKRPVAQQGATFRKEQPIQAAAPAQPTPPAQPANPAPAPAPQEAAASGEPVMMENVGKITAVIPAMKGKSATLTLKPREGGPVPIHFNASTTDVPAMLKMQAAKADVRVICDVTSGEPFLMHIGPADAAA